MIYDLTAYCFFLGSHRRLPFFAECVILCDAFLGEFAEVWSIGYLGVKVEVHVSGG